MKIPQIRHFAMLITIFFTLNATAQRSSAIAHITTSYDCENSILDTAAETKSLKQLFAALQTAELESLLEQEGPFTFFTPNNKAFEQISESQLESLFLLENRPQLRAILSNHIVAGQLSASKILMELCRGGGEATFTTLHGTKIKAMFLNSEIVIRDSTGNHAKIVDADLAQSNGIIHHIDNLVLPSGL